jgi:hypothetical protein
MALSSDAFREKLIQKILAAATQDEVKRFINAAIKGLGQQNTDRQIIQQFAEKAADVLTLYSPFDTSVLEWGNIKRAKVILYRISISMKQPVH